MMTDFYEEFYRLNEMKQWWYVSNSFCTDVLWWSYVQSGSCALVSPCLEQSM